MKRELLGAVLLFVSAGLLHGPAAAPTAQTDPASHHACIEAERQAIERGQGFGMALVADRNGYPGPRHILDSKEELGLSPDQVRDVEQLFERMHTRALALGKELLAIEAELDRLFAEGAPDEAGIRRLLAESAALRADLRWAHLSAHFEARALLTSEQRAHYHALRHASTGHVH